LAYNIVPGSLPLYDFKDLLQFLPQDSILTVNQLNELDKQSISQSNNIEIIKFLTEE
jgi:hypothetical protein